MKPTKEQLADPKWWESQTMDEFNYCYYDKSGGEVIFTYNETHHFFLELLAKRPELEQKWKPKEGEWCEARTSGKWRKVKTLNVDLGNDLMAFYVPVTENGLSRLIWCDNYRPIKTQREKFVEKAMDVYHGGKYSLDMAKALYDSGLFVLTEKAGE
jgi:hypothetical protein